MAHIIFTQQLARFLPVPESTTQAGTLRGALDGVFAGNARLRGYVLDDQGCLRANVAVFVDGVRARDPRVLDDALKPDSAVYVMQALSGG